MKNKYLKVIFHLSIESTVIILLVCSGIPSKLAAQEVSVKEDFESGTPGKFPPGFVKLSHSGPGYPGEWVILRRDKAPSGNYVLAQTAADNLYNRLVPLVHDGTNVKNVSVQTKFMQISGREDRISGLVIRFKDAKNYVFAYASALNLSVRLYKMTNGELRIIEGKYNVNVISGNWYTLKLVAKESNFEVYLDNQLMFQAFDGDANWAGLVGLFTKADTVTLFDDFEFRNLDSVK